MDFGVTMVGYASESTAGVVNLSLGFTPDFVVHISNVVAGQTPDLHYWANSGEFSVWAAALSIKVTGSTGATSVDATGITTYDGGVAVVTAALHRLRDGTLPAVGYVTNAGITIPADHQTNAGNNLVLCFRRDQ